MYFKTNDFLETHEKGEEGCHFPTKNKSCKFSYILRLYLTKKRCQNAQTSMCPQKFSKGGQRFLDTFWKIHA